MQDQEPSFPERLDGLDTSDRVEVGIFMGAPAPALPSVDMRSGEVLHGWGLRVVDLGVLRKKLGRVWRKGKYILGGKGRR